MHLPGSCLCPRSSDLAWVTVTQASGTIKTSTEAARKLSKGVHCKDRRFDERYFSFRGFAASQFVSFWFSFRVKNTATYMHNNIEEI